MGFIGSQEDGLSWLQLNEVEEEDAEASNITRKLAVES